MFNKAISTAWYLNNDPKIFTILTTQFSYQNLHTNLEMKTTQLEQSQFNSLTRTYIPILKSKQHILNEQPMLK
jgi:hypothetical protein